MTSRAAAEWVFFDFICIINVFAVELLTLTEDVNKMRVFVSLV